MNEPMIAGRALGLAKRTRASLALSGLGLIALLAGCAGGGRVADSGAEPWDPSAIPDAVPRVEPKSKYGNPETYEVRGQRYRTRDSSEGFVQRGLASWYGKKFHGRRTSSGERYDMHGMTAAHKTLPLPSYVRVTNVENGRSAVVRVNDRGPFHGRRVIDLSYAAATKLGVTGSGTAMVELRAIDPSSPGSDPGPLLAASHTKSPESSPKSGRGAPARPAGLKRERAAKAAMAAVGAEPIAAKVEPPVPESRSDPVPVPGPETRIAGTPEPSAEEASAQAGSPESSGADTRGPGLYLQVGAFGDPRNADRLRNRLKSELAQGVRVQDGKSDGSGLYRVRVGPLGSEREATLVRARLETLGVDRPSRVWN